MDTAVYDRVSEQGSSLSDLAVRRAIKDVLGMWPREEFVPRGSSRKIYFSTESVIAISAIGRDRDGLTVHFARRAKSGESISYSVRYAVENGTPVRDGAIVSSSGCKRVPGVLNI